MYIRALQVGLNIGDGYQDFEGFEVEVDIKVIEVRFENVGGCKGNACYVDIRIMKHEIITLY